MPTDERSTNDQQIELILIVSSSGIGEKYVLKLNQIKPMTTAPKKSNIIVFVISAVAAVFIAGCAEMQSGNTTSLLVAAGFRARTPQTPKQQQIYAALPPYKVERASVPGKGVFYVYKDEKAGLAYVGREQDYQHYQQLAIHQQIAQDQYMAAQMQADAAWGWYGAWGPRGLWW